MDFGAQEFHAVYVQRLSFGIDFTHEDFAFHAEEGGDGGSGYAVLAGTGFGNEAGLAHPFCQKGLADAVIDLVGAGVVEVFSFQEDAGAAQIFFHIFCFIEHGGAAGVVHEEAVEFVLEFPVFFAFFKGFCHFIDFVHQYFRYILSAVFTKSCFHMYSILFS